MNRTRTETGQAAVMTLLFLTVLLGMGALVLDVGTWYRAHRQVQSTADAAALAAAQSLPYDTGTATNLAMQYANQNGGGVTADGITFSGAFIQNDTVTVKLTKASPSFFGKLFGIDAAQVTARASARAAAPAAAKWVAPIVVNKAHPLLSGPGCPCFNVPTTLPLGKDGAPGAFGLLNLDASVNGAIGSSTLGQWIKRGFDQYLPLGGYYSDPGAKFNAQDIQEALQARYTTELLFPVYDTLTGTGSNASYHIIGWVGFHLTSDNSTGGNSGSLSGWFTRVIWEGIQNSSATDTPDFGVRTISLTQ